MLGVHSPSVHAQEPIKPTANVMVLHGEWIEGYWESQFNRYLYEVLSADQGSTVNVTHEFMGLIELPQAAASPETLAYLQQKADTRSIDLVVALLPLAADFLLAYGDDLFPDTPKVFVVPGADRHADILSRTDAVLIQSSADIGSNLERIFTILPATQQLVVVSGNSPKDQAYLSRAQDALEVSPPDPSVEVRYLVGTPLDELLAEVEQLPERSAIMFLNYSQDEDNRTYITSNMITPFCERANAPVFGFYDSLLGKGIVGGNLTSAEFYGKKAAEIGLEILHGTPPSQLPPVGKVTADLYDWRQLQRWDIPEGRLPPGSIVRYKTSTFWEAYRSYVLTATGVIAVQVMLIAALIITLSRRRRAERRLSQQERFVSAVTDTAPAVIYVYDMAAQRNIYSNRGIGQLLGYGPAEIQSMGAALFPTLIHPEDMDHVVDFQKTIMEAADEDILEIDYRMKHRDGHWTAIHSYERPFSRNPDGSVAQKIGIGIDITERKHAEEELRQKDYIIESASSAMATSDLDGRMTYANPAFLEMWGFDHPDELLGKPFTEHWMVADVFDEVMDALRNQGKWSSETLARRRDGSIFDVQVSAALVRDREGNPVGFMSSSVDSSERKQAETAFLESRQRYQTLAENVSVGIWHANPDGSGDYINPKLAGISGLAPEEAKGDGWATALHPEDRERVFGEWVAFVKGEAPYHSVYRFKRPDGEIRWVVGQAVSVYDRNGEITGHIGSMTDITERKRAEEALRQYTERLRILHEIDRAILEARSPEATAYAALDGLRELVPCQRATITLYDLDANEAIVFATRLNGETRLPRGTRVPVSRHTIDMMWQGKVEVFEDLQALADLSIAHRTLLQEGMRSHVHGPLMVRGELIGSFTLSAAEPGGFPPEQIEIAREVADQLAIALQQSYLYEQVQRHAQELEQRVADRTRELSALYEVAAVASESLDVQSVFAQSLDRVMVAVRANTGVIYLWDEGEELLHLTALAGLPPDLAAQAEAQSGSARQGLIGHVIERNEPLVIPDIATDPRVVLRTSPPLSGPYAGVPMRVRGHTLGVLAVLRWGEEREFNDQEVALLSSIADQVGVVVDSAWLRERAEQAAVLEERQRLARDLHDSVTQSLYSVTLMAETGRRSAEGEDLETVSRYLGRLGDVAQQALKEMRLLIYELRPPVLEREGLVGALQQRLEAVEGRAGVEARLLVEGEVELPALVEGALYRIALEALNNALKHASATAVTVRISPDGEAISLEVADNGRGFDPAATRGGGGMGLTTMRERAERLGGTMTILSAPGEGTRVKVSIGTGGGH